MLSAESRLHLRVCQPCRLEAVLLLLAKKKFLFVTSTEKKKLKRQGSPQVWEK